MTPLLSQEREGKKTPLQSQQPAVHKQPCLAAGRYSRVYLPQVFVTYLVLIQVFSFFLMATEFLYCLIRTLLGAGDLFVILSGEWNLNQDRILAISSSSSLINKCENLLSNGHSASCWGMKTHSQSSSYLASSREQLSKQPHIKKVTNYYHQKGYRNM